MPTSLASSRVPACWACWVRWRWRLADAEPDRLCLRVRVHIGRTEPRPRIDEVGNQSCGKTNHCPSPLTTDEGFIPARAGKTQARPWTSSLPPAHPRSRGENGDPAAAPPSGLGSSPLTRGKRDAGRPQFRNEGFIPTHAGRTSSFSWLLRRSADHPRLREENFLGLIAILIIVSHPPLRRGKRIP